MGDLGKKLELVDSINQQKTKVDLKQLKEEVIGEVKLKFSQEKEKSLQVLKKVSEDSGRELEGLAALLKASQRQQQDNESRLRLMVANLNEELSKMCEDEEREGETTYDSLLRMLEHSCDQVQQAQLR